MQTVASLLKSHRLAKKLTLTGVSRLTKIPVKTLIYLEKNQFNKLPSATYIQGFIQNYAKVIGLNPALAVAVFKRDFDRQQQKKIIPQGLVKPLNSSFNPRFFAGLFIVMIIFSYLIIVVYQIFAPPKLTVDQPQSGEEVQAPFLIKGKTDRDATLTLNNKTVNLEPDGRFITLATTAELNFTATSRRGKSKSLVLHVIIRP